MYRKIYSHANSIRVMMMMMLLAFPYIHTYTAHQQHGEEDTPMLGQADAR